MGSVRKVAVVGAGPAGLAAAWYLSRSGKRVVLYDRRGGAGGLMRSDRLGDVIVDPAVQLVGSSYRTFLRVASETGARSLVVRTPGRDALWRSNRAETITYGSVASMATTSALPLLLKLKLASRYLPYLAQHVRTLDANDLAGTGGAVLDGESIAAWGERELGEDFVEMMAYPLLGAYYGGVPERTSAAFYHALARVGMDVKLYAVRGGVGRMADAIVTALQARGGELRAGTEVERVTAGHEGVGVRGGGMEEEFDACVIAVPAPLLTRVFDLPATLRAWVAGVECPPTLSVAVVTSRPFRADYFGLGFPRTTSPGERVVAACVLSSKSAELVPHGRGLIVAYPSPAVAAQLAASAPESAPDIVLPALAEAFGRVMASADVVKVYRHAEGHTQIWPGYVRHLRRFDAAILPARVALAGDYLVGPTVESAMLSGERAAERLLRLA
jgi:oxygen-dependent protoporphyrinogen oxidase